MLKLEAEVKESSLSIATGSNFNNDRIPFHQPDFTTSPLSNLAARKQCVYCGLSNHLPHKCFFNEQARKKSSFENKEFMLYLFGTTTCCKIL